MKQFIKNHPLAFVIIVAVLLRIMAVNWSKGYMASDDHFETISVASYWMQHGLWDADGHLTWVGSPGSGICRVPLYTLMIYGVMKVAHSFGADSLDCIMYWMRAFHALLSLLSVWGAFRLAEIVTGSKKWAVAAGLVAAANLAMPYLAVRNLIEMVSANFWLLSLLCMYAYQYGKKESKLLLYAGLLTGVAWMFRFEIATAAIVVPFILWYLNKSIKPAIWYSIGVAIILIFTGLIEIPLLGKFMASTFNHIGQINQESAMYDTTPFIYLLLLAGLVVPPFSLYGFYLICRNQVWKNHLILLGSIASFVIIHTIQESRQERYIIPMIVPTILLFILALYEDVSRRGLKAPTPSIRRWIIAPSIVINLLILPVLTFNYSKKGAIEPLVLMEREDGGHGVLFVSPEKGRFYPLEYGGNEIAPYRRVNMWEDLSSLNDSTDIRTNLSFLVLYPNEPDDKSRYEDSVKAVFPTAVGWKHVSPSTVDWVLHKLNPSHNRTNEAWIYKIPH
ncbi:MAG: hypothetical protein WAU88_00965 [Candidatus Zixiibacteriota bacterium]